MTDFAAHLPLELRVSGRLRSTVPGRFWFCEIQPAVVCALGEGVERDHIHPDLLSEDRGSSSAVVLPGRGQWVLQSGIVDFPVHVAKADPARGVGVSPTGSGIWGATLTWPGSQAVLPAGSALPPVIPGLPCAV